MPAFFAITLFLSSALLFLIQPMFAKMVLPLLGGSPAVWNTCMVFFQAALLAGYGYAHLATGRLGIRRQAVLHVGLLLLPFLVLPIALPAAWNPPTEANPIPWLLGLLAVCVGLPFFVVSASGPLLQKWLAATDHPAAKDPYFLYGASNLGSMLALLSYPFVLEPTLPLAEHSWIWTAGYALLVPLMIGCAVFVWRSPAKSLTAGINPRYRPPTLDSGLRTTRRLRWVALAFVPSSLMLSVTTYLTTDVAAIPLLWVIPLALYLLSFILVFARRPLVPHSLIMRLAPLVILLMAIVILSEATEPVWLLLCLHLLALFVIAMLCHGELAKDRPAPEHLTEFYFWLALGGVLGGIFNAIIAPLVFSSVVEYPLMLILACLLRPSETSQTNPGKNFQFSNANSRFAISRYDLVLPILLGMLIGGVILCVQTFHLATPGQVSVALIFPVPAVICYTFLHRPLRFGLGIAALFLGSSFYQGVHGSVLHQERSFFGVHRVTLDPLGRQRRLVHGNTVHGRQSLDPVRRREPLAYYHRTGPIGQVFTELARTGAKPTVAIVGLGAGSLAAYGQSGQLFTYYEIDPTVKRIAEDERYFTFLHDSAAMISIVLGDARLTLKEAPDHEYGLVVLDAFSSDAIPLHLLTRQALGLYKEKLAEGGILAFHVSNRYLELQPVLGDLALDAGLLCWAQKQDELSDAEREEGKEPSHWILMAREKSHLGRLAHERRWQPVMGRPERPVWKDDFSNIFSVFKWF